MVRNLAFDPFLLFFSVIKIVYLNQKYNLLQTQKSVLFSDQIDEIKELF